MTRRYSRAYAWPLFAANSVLVSVHIAAEVAQYLALLNLGVPHWLLALFVIGVGLSTTALAALFGADLYISARDQRA